MFRRVLWWITRPAPAVLSVKEKAIIPELPEENPDKYKPVKTDTEPTS